MQKIDIPGFGKAQLKHLVCDFSGTLSVDGVLLEGVRERLAQLRKKYKLHVITADTHGKARQALKDIKCELTFIEDNSQDRQKQRYIEKLGSDSVVAIGNGNNDYLMLHTARIGIAVCLPEGLSVKAMISADIVVGNICDALDLILKPNRLKGTLRF